MHLRTRIKICGITQLEDAQHCIEVGVDALGFVFYEPSKRAISALRAQQIISRLAPFINCVGLFVNPSADFVNETLDNCQLDTLQFHGDEDEQFCTQFNKPYYKALRMREDIDLASKLECFNSAQGFLFDTYDAQQAGGTGQTFDWSRMPKAVDANDKANVKAAYILAGGLNAENVQKAIEQTSAYAVDVSGGVEQAPGIKSKQKIQNFVQQVSLADKARQQN